jgi:peptide/nickel transport system substrate-binding protein
VTVNVEVVPSDEFFENYVNTGNFDITHFSWIGTQTPISSSTSIYRLDEEVNQNFGRIGSEEINALYEEALQELDDDRRIEIANEIDTLVWEAGHSLLLYQRPNIVGVRDNVANFGAFGFATYDYTAIGFTP